ncbi:Uncharacterised protein [Enterobacter hormaechei]|nr:Uncharacterised protein [Enterobacter hormaechei]SAE34370.1 Uncharacterised protein [Enterobacter hormaechei]
MVFYNLGLKILQHEVIAFLVIQNVKAGNKEPYRKYNIEKHPD